MRDHAPCPSLFKFLDTFTVCVCFFSGQWQIFICPATANSSVDTSFFGTKIINVLILLPAGVIVVIRNFFFPDTVSVHTYPSKSGIRIRNFLNPFPEVEIFEYAMNRNRVDTKSLRIFVYPASDVTRYRYRESSTPNREYCEEYCNEY